MNARLYISIRKGISMTKSIGSVIKRYFDYCGRCGEKREIVDGYTNFGRPSDDEPPEPVNLCGKCVDEEVAMWISLDTMPAHWIRANYETKLAKILGFEWVYISGCSWGAWQPTEERLNKWLQKSHQ